MSDKTIAGRVRIPLYIALVISFTIASAASSKLHDREYTIISAVINHGLSDGSGNIIIDETTTGETVNVIDPAQSSEELAEELGTTTVALGEWSRTNRNRSRLQAQLAINSEYFLLAENERAKIFNDEDPAANWRQFRTRFPDAAGIVRVSRPGIDDSAKTAILYLEFECGPQCGSGRLVNLVQTVEDRWQVTTATLIWITSPE